MKNSEYQELVKEIRLGKQLPDAIYLHSSALVELPLSLQDFLTEVVKIIKLSEKSWNVVKFCKNKFKLSFLLYLDFFSDSYPALTRSCSVDLENFSCRKASYARSENPPILHRKETFLHPSHPFFIKFAAITKEGEEAGLYAESGKIGFKKYWMELIHKKGLLLVDGHLILKTKSEVNDEMAFSQAQSIKRIERHKTAIDRTGLSVPMQSLLRHQYLDGNFSVFDYGCGKGDDINILNKYGTTAKGWDPVYFPDYPVGEADIINLGFVLNVIEDPNERQVTLRKAYSLAKLFLVASVMLGGETTISKYEKYGDGVVTSRKTFQKYYSQNEFRGYLEESLNNSVVAVGPGIFYIFKDKAEEQRFLVERQRSKGNWRKLSYTDHPERLKIKQRALYERHKELLEDFWQQCHNLGRLPANKEFEKSEELKSICFSHQKAFNLLTTVHDPHSFVTSAETKRNDLLVHFALSLFEQRRPYKAMPESLQRDVKYFFSSHAQALIEARELLFSVGKPEVINQYCEQAYRLIGCGFLEAGHSFTVHRLYVEQLPPALRVYIGCATQLYGDLDSVELVKIHIRSGKVSLLCYDDFDENPLPLLQKRIKIKLREQAIDFFEYGEKFKPMPLYLKSDFITKEFRYYSKQKKFDDRLKLFKWLDLDYFGPTLDEFKLNLLNKERKIIYGYQFRDI